MNVDGIINRAKSLATQGAHKAKRYASENSGTVDNGLGKAERFVNSKTGGKYRDQIAKGREGISNALGVPNQTRQAFDDGRAAPERPSGPVSTDPIVTDHIDRPEDIDKPRPV